MIQSAGQTLYVGDSAINNVRRENKGRKWKRPSDDFKMSFSDGQHRSVTINTFYTYYHMFLDFKTSILKTRWTTA